MQTDALIVGGGPVGLALALGLKQRGLKVIVLERNRVLGEDWSSAYTYRIDSRGLACLESIGLLREIEKLGVESRGFSSTVWEHDGSTKSRTANASIGLGYWIQRPALLRLLESALPSDMVLTGTLKHLEIAEAAVASVEIDGVIKTISSSLVFGCDGSRSTVRQSIQNLDNDSRLAFEPQCIKTPSTGLIFKAVLYQPPESLPPGRMINVKGKSGLALSMLPFSGEVGQARPLSFAQQAGHILHSFKTPAEVYEKLGQEFPQLDIERRLSPASAAAWCSTPGSTFPHARWCNKSAFVTEKVGIALLGDALHCFPPDLGQGVNAGFSDVNRLLKLWPSNIHSASAMQQLFAQYESVSVPEAEAICRLLPIGMPYQYNLPFSFAKVVFFGGLLVRLAANKLCPMVFSRPAIFLVTSDPPLLYSEVLERHNQTNRRLLAAAIGLVALVAGSSKHGRSWLR